MEAKARTIESYLTAGGQCPFEQWMDKLRGDTIHGRIIDRLEKVKRGNLGDWKALGEGANELRIDFGEGYRVYFGFDGDKIILFAVERKDSPKASQRQRGIGETTMPKRTRSYDSWLLKELTDPVVAADYINAASEDSEEMLLVAMRNVAESHKMSRVAEEASVNRESLYKTLSAEGNPRLGNFRSILDVFGLKVLVAPKEAVRAERKIAQQTIGSGSRVNLSASVKRKRRTKSKK
jgi:putative addiction module killer protein/probable addiction module antidote protein